jgi:hypothetical protein
LFSSEADVFRRPEKSFDTHQEFEHVHPRRRGQGLLESRHCWPSYPTRRGKVFGKVKREKRAEFSGEFGYKLFRWESAGKDFPDREVLNYGGGRSSTRA